VTQTGAAVSEQVSAPNEHLFVAEHFAPHLTQAPVLETPIPVSQESQV